MLRRRQSCGVRVEKEGSSRRLSARKGGIFRSNDRGGSWERRNEFDAGAMYYSRIVADPKDVDRVYVMNVFLMVSDDGGRTLRRLGEKSKHVDNHDIWIDSD